MKIRGVKLNVLRSLSKPRIPREITKLAGISKRWNTRRALKELEVLGLIVCISKSVKRANLYAITYEGLEYLEKIKEEAKEYLTDAINKKIDIDLDIPEYIKKLEGKYNNYLYIEKLKQEDIDWDAYAWIINSNRRQKILKALRKDIPKTTHQIRTDSIEKIETSSGEDIIIRIPMDKIREILKNFLERGLVQSKKRKHKRKEFYLTEKGEKVLEIMVK